MTAADTTAAVALFKTAGATANAYSTHVFVTKADDPLPAWSGTTTGYPYVLVHPSEGIDTADRLTGPPTTTHPEFTLHIVGQTSSSVQAATALIKAKCKPDSFVIAPTVAGRRNYNAYWRARLLIQTEPDVNPWLVYQVIEYGWASDPS